MLGEMRQPIIHIEAKVTEIHESFQGVHVQPFQVFDPPT